MRQGASKLLVLIASGIAGDRSDFNAQTMNYREDRGDGGAPGGGSVVIPTRRERIDSLM